MQEALEVERRRLEERMAEREEEQRQLHMTINEALQLRLSKLEQFKQMFRVFQSEFPKEDKFKVKQGFWHLSWRCQVCKKKSEDEGRWMCPDCGHVQENIS